MSECLTGSPAALADRGTGGRCRRYCLAVSCYFWAAGFRIPGGSQRWLAG